MFTSKKNRDALILIFISLILGMVYTVIQNNSFEWINLRTGALHGLLIGSFLVVYMKFISPHVYSYIRTIPIYLQIITTSLIYLFLIFFGRALAFTLFNGKEFEFIGTDKNFLSTVFFAFIILLIANLLIQISNILGRRVMFNFLIGKYKRSREEQRMIMFLDITDSTKIAEKIGNDQYLKLLDEFFYYMTEPLVDSSGEIHKYIGDEVIVTWRNDRANFQNGINFYFRFKKNIEKNKAKFEKTFGLFPLFKASIHIGDVIIGEMGNIKKEIAFLGDAVNTTARILDYGKRNNHNLTLSKSKKSIDLDGLRKKYIVTNLGKQHLRGKQQSLELFEVAMK